MRIENSCALCKNGAYSPKTGYVCSMGAICADNIGDCIVFDPDYGKVVEDESLCMTKNSEIVWDEKNSRICKERRSL